MYEITYMKRSIQSVLLVVYRYALATGILSTTFGRVTFEFFYFNYKALFEASEASLLQNFVVKGETVIDVGANIGFFTVKFAQWVGSSGKVIAIEPEKMNFDRLKNTLTRIGLISRVSLIQAVAADKSGHLRLAINPVNPMDHRISENGILVSAITIDDLCERHGWPTLCLIKIDVQGSEGLVIDGAIETLNRCGPALFIEIEESSLCSNTFKVFFLEKLTFLGYWPYLLKKNGAIRLENINALITIVKKNGYADFLFLKSKGH